LPRQIETQNWILRRENERQREQLQRLLAECEAWRAWYKRLLHKVEHLSGVMDLAPVEH